MVEAYSAIKTRTQNSMPNQADVPIPITTSIINAAIAIRRNHIMLRVGLSARVTAVTIMSRLTAPQRTELNMVSA